jgi:hypothetical protein
MVKGSRILGEGAPPLAQWLVDELDRIDPKLRWMWMPDHKRWAVVTPAPPQVFRKGFHVEAVCMGDNGEYREPDMRFINFLRMTKYERDKLWTFDEYLASIDRAEDEKAEEAQDERRLMFSDFAKKVWRALHTKTFT